MTTTLDDLNRRHGLPGVLRFEAGVNGLPRAVVTTPQAEAHVYLHGAHVAHYQRPGQAPVLFMSRASQFTEGKPIRGGVPVIFPWFGALPGHPEAPAHGLVRQRPWEVESATRDNGGAAALTLMIRDDAQTLAAWPHAFELRHRVTVGETLAMALEVRNTGAQAFRFEEGLHTYFRVGDVRQVRVTGLEGVDYLSKAEGGVRKTQQGPITVTGETDRVYRNTAATCVLEDPSLERRITVAKNGSGTTVVWNPWIERAKAIADFGDAEWVEMICIETVNAGEQAVTLAPGAAHTMTATIRS